MLARRTGRDHAHWLSELATLRAAPRAPGHAPHPTPHPKPGLGQPAVLALGRALLEALRAGPVEMKSWRARRGLDAREAYKAVRTLRRLGHKVETEGAGRYRLHPSRSSGTSA